MAIRKNTLVVAGNSPKPLYILVKSKSIDNQNICKIEKC
ncbi:unknown [Alistipes sp. CAG:831]|nr:unknown [Alistipes sp. CAG:831]